MSEHEFTVIGENVHTSRIVLKKGRRWVQEDGVEGVPFTAINGQPRLLPVSEAIRSSRDYEEGRIKHMRLAVEAAMAGGPDADDGQEYLRRAVSDQEEAGAHFLDINVDEISLELEEQRAAMAWLAHFVTSISALPISSDSSDLSVIEAGLVACAGSPARPMLNSASLERIEALDLAADHDARVIVTASGDSGMPSSADERVENASKMANAALANGIPHEDIFIDPLVFPISVDSTFGVHTLDAIRMLRAEYGPAIHITGGMSNVSFGIPSRSIMNTVFINLAVEAGADSGIIDPVMNRVDRVFRADRESPSYTLAENALLGRDEHCLDYIRAWRAGELNPLESN